MLPSCLWRKNLLLWEAAAGGGGGDQGMRMIDWELQSRRYCEQWLLWYSLSPITDANSHCFLPCQFSPPIPCLTCTSALGHSGSCIMFPSWLAQGSMLADSVWTNSVFCSDMYLIQEICFSSVMRFRSERWGWPNSCWLMVIFSRATLNLPSQIEIPSLCGWDHCCHAVFLLLWKLQLFHRNAQDQGQPWCLHNLCFQGFVKMPTLISGYVYLFLWFALTSMIQAWT